MHYKLVFDLAATSPNWSVAVPFLIPVSICSIMVFFSKFRTWADKIWRIWSVFNLGFCLLVTTALAWGVISDYYKAKAFVEHGTIKIVEGPVENFKPIQLKGQSSESFDVNGKHFEYSDHVTSW